MYIIFAQNGSGFIEKIYLICLDKLFDSAAQLGDDLVFALMNLFPIKGSVFGVKSKQLKLGCFPVELCGVEHRLGGDAAAV